MRVFGTGTRVARRGLGQATLACQQCGRPTEHSISSRRTWITVLYVGVIPLAREYFTSCRSCKLLAPTDRQTAEALVA
jgi:hypothetical protein